MDIYVTDNFNISMISEKLLQLEENPAIIIVTPIPDIATYMDVPLNCGEEYRIMHNVSKENLPLFSKLMEEDLSNTIYVPASEVILNASNGIITGIVNKDTVKWRFIEIA